VNFTPTEALHNLPGHKINVLEGNGLSVAGEAICDIETQTANSNTLKASLQQHSNIT
jgi:hypothetical protein